MTGFARNVLLDVLAQKLFEVERRVAAADGQTLVTNVASRSQLGQDKCQHVLRLATRVRKREEQGI